MNVDPFRQSALSFYEFACLKQLTSVMYRESFRKASKIKFKISDINFLSPEEPSVMHALMDPRNCTDKEYRVVDGQS